MGFAPSECATHILGSGVLHNVIPKVSTHVHYASEMTSRTSDPSLCALHLPLPFPKYARDLPISDPNPEDVSTIADKPVIKDLIKAFDRWQKQEPWIRDRTHAEILLPRVLATVGTEPQERVPVRTPNDVAFIYSCPILSLTSILLVDRNCDICTKPYCDGEKGKPDA